MPMSVYGLAAMIVAMLDVKPPKLRWVVVVPIANTVGFILTGSIWEQLNRGIFNAVIDPTGMLGFFVTIGLVAFSTGLGLLPTMKTLHLADLIATHVVLRLVVLGAGLGMMAVILTNIDLPQTTRPWRAFATMAIWQANLLAAQAYFQYRHRARLGFADSMPSR